MLLLFSCEICGVYCNYSMNKYQKIPDTIVDLHGYTTAEAKVLLDDLLSEAKYRHVRIITGKGLHGTGVAVLRTFVKNYLLQKAIRFEQAKIQDGGEGAMEVFL
jgi:DNA-nicking Smr family endonuclease